MAISKIACACKIKSLTNEKNIFLILKLNDFATPY